MTASRAFLAFSSKAIQHRVCPACHSAEPSIGRQLAELIQLREKVRLIELSSSSYFSGRDVRRRPARR
jgi:hypothetical protein